MTMCYRNLSILLIGTTLAGQSFCCCMLEAANVESPKSCCCPIDDSAQKCPGNSDGQQHKCQCRQHRAIAARLSGESLLLTAPSVKWLVELAQHFAPVCMLRPVEVAFHSLALSKLISGPHQNGSGILLALCVRRC